MPESVSTFSLRPDIPGETASLNAIRNIVDNMSLAWIDEVDNDDTIRTSSVLPPITEPSVEARMLPQRGVTPAEVFKLDDLLLLQQIQEHAAEATVYRTGDRGSMTWASIWQVEKIREEIKGIFDTGRERALLEPCIYDNEVINILKYFDNVNELVAGDYGYLTPEQLEEKVNKNDFENLPPLYARLLRSRKSNREKHERLVQELKDQEEARAKVAPKKETTTQLV